MARIRTIKPEFWQHAAMGEEEPETRLIAIALLNHADDHGYFNAHPRIIESIYSPMREPTIPVADSLDRLMQIGYIRLGATEEGKEVGQIINFNKHQVIDRPGKPRFDPDEVIWDEWDQENLFPPMPRQR